MEDMHLGPNGGLIKCFEFLMQNIDFLTEPLETVTDEYLIVIDMPGQIELYTHVPILPSLVKELTRGSLNINMCACYLLESTFVVDRPKFFAGTLSAMSAMLMLELPHVNVLSKMDLIKDSIPRRDLKRFLDPDVSLLYEDADRAAQAANADQALQLPVPMGPEETSDPSRTEDVMAGKSFQRLNRVVGNLIDDFSMVSFLKLDAQDEDSVGAILSYIDDAIQFHEAQEPREPMDDIDPDDIDPDDMAS